MKREELKKYISYCLDDSLNVRSVADMPENARLVVWQCGFEPVVVAVWSYLGVSLSSEDAEDIAVDYLAEKKWFRDDVVPADYVL